MAQKGPAEAESMPVDHEGFVELIYVDLAFRKFCYSLRNFLCIVPKIHQLIKARHFTSQVFGLDHFNIRYFNINFIGHIVFALSELL